MLFLEIIIPLATPTTYHYQLAPHLHTGDAELLVGCRAVIPFGSKRFYTGVIISVSALPPEGIEPNRLKHILSLVDESPLIPNVQIGLWHWLADYYCSSLGSVLRLAMPHGLLPESHTIIRLNTEFVASSQLSTLEERVLDLLASYGDEGLTLERLQTLSGERISRAYYRLLSLGAISTDEILRVRYKPKLKSFISLTDKYRTDEAISEAFLSLKRAPRRAEVLTYFLSRLTAMGLDLGGAIPRSDLYGSTPTAQTHIRKLIDQGILQVIYHEDSRLISTVRNLSEGSEEGLRGLQPKGLTQGVTLLRTRDVETKECNIIAWVRAVVSAGGQVLLLSPSAAGVPRANGFMDSLRWAASGKVYHYHPEVSENRRTELFRHLSRTDEACLILGNRSAVFLPCRRLRLIIIDDEQEYMYKHQYTAPQYHARDVALYLGNKLGIPIVLSSTNPSAETLFNVLRGKYSLIEDGSADKSQYPVPRIEIIDLKKERAKTRGKKRSVISPTLISLIGQTIERGERVLLLQNRRGYAPYLRCTGCSTTIKCPHCALSLAYYDTRHLLVCQQCGYSEPIPQSCPSCGASVVERRGETVPSLQLIGYGTERVEEEVCDLFPDARVMRLDGETLQSAVRRQESLERIEAGDVDILVATPMIKSQPIWNNIGLIAVVQLDDLLAYPDFRTAERAYQFLYQMVLYSRQNDTIGTTQIVLQTVETEQPFIEDLKRFDYDAFIKSVLAERQRYNWPPFSRVTYVQLKGYDLQQVERASSLYAQALQRYLGADRVSGAQALSQNKIEGRYVRQIVCRRPYNISFRKERLAFTESMQWFRATYPEYARVHIIFDVDPL